MTRRGTIAILAGGFAASSPLNAKDGDLILEILEASQKDKKGVMVYVKGQAIGGAVTKIEGEFVELRSREYSRVVLRLASIDGVAMA